MKNIRKFLAIILSIAMVMCSTLPSVASEIEVIDETTKSKIEEQLREDLGEERANEILNVGADEETTSVGAKLCEPAEEEEENQIEAQADEEVEETTLSEPEEETEETTAGSASVRPYDEEDEEPTATPSELSEIDEEEIGTEEPTMAEPVELEISIASKSTTDKTLYGADEPWMYWYLTDEDGDSTKETIHFSSTDPGGVGAKAITAINTINYDELEKTDITKAIFENQIVAKTCANWFKDFTNLSEIKNLSNLITDNVDSLFGMFYSCQSLNHLDLSSFKTPMVANMMDMFCGCSALRSVNLSSFETTELYWASSMFNGCSSLTFLDLSSFDVSSLTICDNMFKDCTSLHTIAVSNNFNAIFHATSGGEMFKNCTSIRGCKGTTYSDTMAGTYLNRARIDGGSAEPGYFSPAPWMLLYQSDDETMHYTSPKPLSGNYGMVTDTDDVFYHYVKDNIKPDITKVVFDDDIEAETFRGFFSGFTNLSTIEGLDKLKITKVNNMQNMFNNCSSLTRLDLRSFDTTNVTKMQNMFTGCSSLKTIVVSDDFVTTNLTDDGSDMFKGCTSLVGGNGTVYTDSKINKEYARIDGGTSAPGYFTDASTVPWMYWWLTDEDKTINYQSYDPGGVGAKPITGTNAISYDGLDSTVRENITKAVFEDEIEAETCEKLFNEFYTLKTIVSIENLKTSKVTNMNFMFSGCTELTVLDVTNFDTSEVTHMNFMFNNCFSLIELDLKSFKVNNVEGMCSMFYSCRKLTKLNITSFSPNKVKDFYGFLGFCSELDDIDLSGLDTSSADDMKNMFRGCEKLQILDLSSFNTENVTDMSEMFADCLLLEKIIVSSKFDTSKVTDSNDMFTGCTKLVGGAGTAYDSEHIDVEYARIDEGTTAPGYFTGVTWMYWRLEDNETGKTIIFSSTDEGKTGTTGIVGDAAIDYGSLDKNTVTKAVFEDEIMAVTCRELFCEFSNLKEIKDLAKLETNKVTDMRSMFRECLSLESFDIEYLDTSDVEDMSYLFYSCMKLTSLDVSKFITQQVKNMYGMFGYCTALTDLNLDNFNTENVENMQQMFRTCMRLTYLDLSNFDTSKVTNMKDMFFDCGSLETIVVGNNFVTNIVTSSDNMFMDCYKLVGCYGTAYDENKTGIEYARIDGYDEHGARHPGYFSSAPWMYWYLDNNDTAIHYSSTEPASGGVAATRRDSMVYSGLSKEQKEKITNATFENRIDAATCDSFFKYFRNLSSIENLDNLATANVTDMDEMFLGCENLENLHWENLYASKVESMVAMFLDCKKLKSLVLSRWNTESLLSMVGMFENCSSLTLLDIKSLNTSFVRHMYRMFSGCSSLKELDLSNFNTASLIEIDYMFAGCSSLESIYVSNEFVTTAVTNDTEMFEGCTSLKGSSGTTYDESHIGKEYARIDEGAAAPGYFYTNDWMWWAYDDTEHILYLYGTEPSIFDNVISGSGPITYISSTKMFIEKVVFENEVRARTCERMFDDFYYLKEIVGIDNLNTSSVMSMEGMFNSCNSLDKIDLSKFDTSRVTNMRHMFVSCRELDELDLTAFDTSNVINMAGMFAGCDNLTKLDLSKFDTKNVTDLMEFLYGCEKLPSIDLSSFGTSNVTDMSKMFSDCERLVTITTSSKFDTSKVNPSVVFAGCLALKGGRGTTYDPSRTSIEYARIDGGPTSATPGYFTLYVPPTPPASTPTYPQNYSSDRDGGGSGGGGPLVNVIIPAVTYLPIVKNILATLNNTTSKWTKDAVANKYKLNIINQNGTETPLTLGFYNYTNVVTHIVNNVPVQTQTNDTYVFDEKGNMITGWVRTADGKWYLFEYEKTTNEGKMVIGWKKVQGAWYYFGTDGAMLTNAYTPDGHYVGPDGKWVG